MKKGGLISIFGILMALGVVVFLVLILGGIKGCQIYQIVSNPYQPPPEAVTVAKVGYVDWQDTIESIGEVRAVNGATLRFEDSGRVAKVYIDSGSQVRRGDLVLELDVTLENAELDGSRALLKSTRNAFERSKVLFTKEATSVSKLESDEFAFRDADAKVRAIEARIAKKRIIAPFDGRLGVRRVNVGDYVTPNVDVIPLYQLDRLYVDFNLPERFVGSTKIGDRINVLVEAGRDVVISGVVTSIDPSINPQSKNFMLQATIDKPASELRPGMFCVVNVLSGDVQSRLMIPSSSIVSAPYGDSVFVIIKDEKDGSLSIRQQFIKVGPKKGDLAVVEEGLKEGEDVVTSAGFKLRPGIKVIVPESVKPDAEINPQPENR